MNQIQMAQNGQTMTSKEMAELTEKRHDSVKRTIVSLSKKALISYPQFVDGIPGANGVSERVYYVNKRDSYVVVAQLSPEFTARLVDRWQELEAVSPKAINLDDPRALRAALLSYSERVIQLDAKIAADAPKVEFAELIRAMDAVCHVGSIAKTLGIGRTKFFAKLRDDSILMKNNLPYQKYVDKGYFTVIEQEPYTDSKGVEHPTFTSMVTGAGQVFLQRKYGRRKDDLV